MLTIASEFLRIPALHVWWPTRVQDVESALPRAPVVTVMQCGAALADALQEYAFRRRTFHTLVIDLTLSKQELWSQLHARSCRCRISQAKRLGCEASVNDDRDGAFQLVREFMHRRGYGRPPSITDWRQAVAHGDVSTVRFNGKLAAAHVYLVDERRRARLLWSATAEWDPALGDRVLGKLNRYLYWHDIDHYRVAGVREFDFGGVTLDQASPLYSIAQFKMSFGGNVVSEQILRLARNPGLRLPLKGALDAGRVVLGRARRFGEWRRAQAAGSTPDIRASLDAR